MSCLEALGLDWPPRWREEDRWSACRLRLAINRSPYFLLEEQAMESNRVQLGAKQIGIVILTLATAFIHFSLLFPDLMFILNGLGYLALLAAYFLPLPVARDNHGLLRWVFMAFAAVTILAWLVMGDKSWPAGALGYTTKVIEVILLALLWTDRA
jgi:hypothetical protein